MPCNAKYSSSNGLCIFPPSGSANGAMWTSGTFSKWCLSECSSVPDCSEGKATKGGAVFWPPQFPPATVADRPGASPELCDPDLSEHMIPSATLASFYTDGSVLRLQPYASESRCTSRGDVEGKSLFKTHSPKEMRLRVPVVMPDEALEVTSDSLVPPRSMITIVTQVQHLDPQSDQKALHTTWNTISSGQKETEKKPQRVGPISLFLSSFLGKLTKPTPWQVQASPDIQEPLPRTSTNSPGGNTSPVSILLLPGLVLPPIQPPQIHSVRLDQALPSLLPPEA